MEDRNQQLALVCHDCVQSLLLRYRDGCIPMDDRNEIAIAHRRAKLFHAFDAQCMRANVRHHHVFDGRIIFDQSRLNSSPLRNDLVRIQVTPRLALELIGHEILKHAHTRGTSDENHFINLAGIPMAVT